jgi:hypothetical protein
LVERSPEKAGVGGSIPSLATIFTLQNQFSANDLCVLSGFYKSVRIALQTPSDWFRGGLHTLCPHTSMVIVFARYTGTRSGFAAVLLWVPRR